MSGTGTWLAAGPPVSDVAPHRLEASDDHPVAPWDVVARVPWLPSSGGCFVSPIDFCADMEVSYCSIRHLEGIFEETHP